MDPLCISLVHQYLDSTNSALADQFKDKYQPQKSNVQVKEVLSKWKEEQLVRGLIFEHLKTLAPSLAVEFRERHRFSVETAPKYLVGDIQKKIGAIAIRRRNGKVVDESAEKQEQNDDGQRNSISTEEQLVRGLIYEHLKTVAPSLAVEFQNTYLCCSEIAPKHPLEELQKKVFAIANRTGITKVDGGSGRKEKQNYKRKPLGMKVKTYSKEELVRIERAMTNDEDIKTVAKEMGRNYQSVYNKIRDLQRHTGLRKGKFSAEEIERVKQAVANNEDYKSVAAELGRSSKSVHHKMFQMKGNSGSQCKGKVFTFNEDLHILDKIIPRLEFQKLTSAGFLSQSQFLELAKELHRNGGSIRARWEGILQPWLLQHYAGTSGFRIERMLTSLVAEKFNDHKGIDWSEILNQHKDFAGHTTASIRQTYHKVHHLVRNTKEGKKDVSLQEVADFAAAVYQPGKERQEPAAKVVHREKIILYFKERVAELGINVVV